MKTYKLILLPSMILILLVSSCGTPDLETPVYEEVLEKTPTLLVIDGTISPGEWSEAETYEFSSGSDLYLLRKDQTLYLAVIGSTPGILGANIFLYQDGQVQIMHISAALGTAEYERDEDNWSLIRNFDWQHRSVGNGELALAEREAYFETEGWSAPNARTGTANHLEMQLHLESEEQRIVISLIQSYSDIRIVWPTDLEDDTGTPFSDGLPTSLSVMPDNWYSIP